MFLSHGQHFTILKNTVIVDFSFCYYSLFKFILEMMPKTSSTTRGCKEADVLSHSQRQSLCAGKCTDLLLPSRDLEEFLYSAAQRVRQSHIKGVTYYRHYNDTTKEGQNSDIINSV